jgi:hypothetical protein
MVYAPGHFKAVTQRRERSTRERLSVRIAGLLTIAIVGLVVFSVTTRQKSSGNGCVDFNYSTMIGGAETYKCGSAARRLCATPASARSIDTDFQVELYKACRKAEIPTRRS